jgi:predicted membrane channel-forming protein YqfA (hemolysin III family)
MSYEEKRTWVYLLASGGAYLAYVVIVLQRAAHTPVAEVPYISVLLWSCVASVVASTVGHVAFETARPSDSRRADVRDKEIARFGDYVSRWFIIAGAVAALLMALARWEYFWIANVIYLGFVLWAVVGSAVKLVAYRRGL